jgi:hypothetical protein
MVLHSVVKRAELMVELLADEMVEDLVDQMVHT